MKTIALATLAASLALDAGTATEGLVLAAIDRLKADRAGSEAALASTRTALGLADDATSEAVLAAVTAAKAAGSPDPTKYVPKAGFDDVSARLAKIENERVLASVDAAVAAGKLPPTLKAWAIELGQKDEAALAAYLGSVPAFAGGKLLDGKPVAEKGKLTAEEKVICSQLGVSEADFLKTRDIEEAA